MSKNDETKLSKEELEALTQKLQATASTLRKNIGEYVSPHSEKLLEDVHKLDGGVFLTNDAKKIHDTLIPVWDKFQLEIVHFANYIGEKNESFDDKVGAAISKLKTSSHRPKVLTAKHFESLSQSFEDFTDNSDVKEVINKTRSSNIVQKIQTAFHQVAHVIKSLFTPKSTFFKSETMNETRAYQKGRAIHEKLEKYKSPGKKGPK